MIRDLFILFGLAGGLFIFIFQLASVLTSMSYYPRYKQTYRALITGRYRIDNISLTGISRFYDTKKNNNEWAGLNEEHEILIFPNGSIKLIQDRSIGFWGSAYIHSGPIIMKDLYSLYWYYKIHRWYKKNKQSLINEEVIWHKIKK